MTAPRFATIPKVLETPKEKDLAEDVENLGPEQPVGVGDVPAELVDAYDVQSIRQGLSRLARDHPRRTQLRQLGFRRASEFSWTRTAQATLDIYQATSPHV